MTSPEAFTSGPPELPGLMAASVWIMSTYTPPPSARPARLRPTALTTPTETLGSLLPSTNPNGFPMAMVHSPTIKLLDVPSGATASSFALIRTTAKSFVSSTPTTAASYVVPSRIATCTLVAPAMTCALVTITPSARTTNPEPIPALRRSPERPPVKYSKKSTGTRSTVSVCTVTTAGATRSTAAVMAVRRDASTFEAGTGPPGSGCAGGSVRDWADESDGVAPSQPTRVVATSTTIEKRESIREL